MLYLNDVDTVVLAGALSATDQRFKRDVTACGPGFSTGTLPCVSSLKSQSVFPGGATSTRNWGTSLFGAAGQFGGQDRGRGPVDDLLDLDRRVVEIEDAVVVFLAPPATCS